ncbi:MAG: hypothetical protein ACFCU3_06930 [Verrucomicrobiales bacterium]
MSLLPRTQRGCNSAAGFSLVEIVLAIGVLVFCLLAILGLLTVGHESAAVSSETIHAVGVASHLISERSKAPLANSPTLPPMNQDGTGEVLVDRFGAEVADAANAAYRVTWRYTRPAANSRMRVLTLDVGWPAAAPADQSEKISVSTAVSMQ